MGELIRTQMVQLYPFGLAKAIADLFLVKKSNGEIQ
jgi:flagellar motor switch protein FliN/FliY